MGAMSWKPPTDQLSYWNTQAPADTEGALYAIALPCLEALGLASATYADPSHGRLHLPYHPDEQFLHDHYHVEYRQILTDEKYQTRIRGSSELQAIPGATWITYQIWQKKASLGQHTCDLLYLHGINDYAGSFAPHAPRFLDAGYRVICPDLPAHGRSTGLHVYLRSIEYLSDAAHLVRKDLKIYDEERSLKPAKTFVGGSSMGGYAAASYTLRYGTQDSSLYSADFPLAGAILLCPMLEVSKESRPPLVIELAAKAIRALAPRLPLAEANKGKNSEDPTLELMFLRNPQTYHGKLRIATGLAILDGLLSIPALFKHLSLPFLAVHGTGDRVTDYRATRQLFTEAPSTDKTLELLDGYEHVLLRRGQDAEDDQKRQRVLDIVVRAAFAMAWLDFRTASSIGWAKGSE